MRSSILLRHNHPAPKKNPAKQDSFWVRLMVPDLGKPKPGFFHFAQDFMVKRPRKRYAFCYLLASSFVISSQVTPFAAIRTIT